MNRTILRRLWLGCLALSTALSGVLFAQTPTEPPAGQPGIAGTAKASARSTQPDIGAAGGFQTDNGT